MKRFLTTQTWPLALAVGLTVALASGQMAAAHEAESNAQPAQPAPAQSVDQPAEFAMVRAKFENMTPDQIAAAGYVAAESPPVCISEPPGGMGFHYVNRQLHASQFDSGRMDPQNPPLLLLDGNQRVVGLEWEVNKNTQPPPVLFGQNVPLLPGHPGVPEEHYMLHGYFKPNSQVLFDVFDPTLEYPADTTGAGGPPETVGMPRTGSPLVLPLIMVVGMLLLATGGVLRRRKA